jgi:hypothetical protein
MHPLGAVLAASAYVGAIAVSAGGSWRRERLYLDQVGGGLILALRVPLTDPHPQLGVL